MPRKVSTTVNFDEETLEKLREESKRSGIPMAVLIRRAVELFLDPGLKLTQREV